MNTLPTMLASALLAAPVAAHDHKKPPAGHPLGVQSVDIYAEGSALHLLTVEYEAQGKPPVIKYSSSTDGGASFSQARRVEQELPPIAYANRGNDIPLAARGGRIVTLWPGKGKGYMGSGPVIVSASDDSGRTWQRGNTPADDGTQNGHRFLAAVADVQGVFHAVWLDNRTGIQALYHASSSDDGQTWTANVAVDSATCECCWNRIAAAPDGALYVLYRGKNPRDMALAVSHDSGKTWALRKNLGGFDWKINLCPHVGGGLALTRAEGRQRVHALAYNGKEGAEGLYYMSSSDDGLTWTLPQRLGDERAHHADLAASPDGKRLLAVWDTMGGSGEVYASESDGQGRSWSSPKLLSSGAGRASHPRAIGLPQGFRVFWTEQPQKGASVLKIFHDLDPRRRH